MAAIGFKNNNFDLSIIIITFNTGRPKKEIPRGPTPFLSDFFSINFQLMNIEKIYYTIMKYNSLVKINWMQIYLLISNLWNGFSENPENEI